MLIKVLKRDAGKMGFDKPVEGFEVRFYRVFKADALQVFFRIHGVFHLCCNHGVLCLQLQ